ncbi:hypothetical protein ASC68_19665 [Devosia sp. Root105]|nr:hypothetical protein ASC68_19665 [Devosia sp. Root105]
MGGWAADCMRLSENERSTQFLTFAVSPMILLGVSPKASIAVLKNLRKRRQQRELPRFGGPLVA